MINYAKQLVGQTLDGGWKVVQRLDPTPDSTGGCFSVRYIVESPNGKKAFLKALDYSKALNSPDPARELQELTTAYNFERDILNTCKTNKLKHIVTAITDGKCILPNSPYPIEYLIFELADGDVRRFLSISSSFDTAWALRILHQVAVGLNQLHQHGIAHQDLKPSNVLIFNGNLSKISDLGRSISRVLTNPRHQFYNFAGDPAYAPPELLYGQVDPDWNKRRLGCDIYHLGSLILFFFGNTGMTVAILNEMPRSFYPLNGPDGWQGTYKEVLPYVRDAFNKVIEKFELLLNPNIQIDFRSKDLSREIVWNATKGLILFRKHLVEEGRTFYKKAINLASVPNYYKIMAALYLAREEKIADTSESNEAKKYVLELAQNTNNPIFKLLIKNNFGIEI